VSDSWFLRSACSTLGVVAGVCRNNSFPPCLTLVPPPPIPAHELRFFHPPKDP
jgi:hypothetical protein